MIDLGGCGRQRHNGVNIEESEFENGHLQKRAASSDCTGIWE